jgi:hypothetical protein
MKNRLNELAIIMSSTVSKTTTTQYSLCSDIDCTGVRTLSGLHVFLLCNLILVMRAIF